MNKSINKQRWVVPVLIALIGGFMSILDSSIVNVAIPTMAQQEYENSTILYLKPDVVNEARVSEIAAKIKAAGKWILHIKKYTGIPQNCCSGIKSYKSTGIFTVMKNLILS